MKRALAAVLVVVVGVAASCSDDQAESTVAGPTPTDATAPISSVPQTTTESSTTAAVATGDVKISTHDFTFTGVPGRAVAGARLTFVNTSTTDVHEMVVARLRDGETRSAATIMALPDADMAAAFDATQPAVVIVAGDGRVQAPGRYIVLCAIPTGISPADYFATVATAPGPLVIDGHPPHCSAGMFAEMVVE